MHLQTKMVTTHLLAGVDTEVEIMIEYGEHLSNAELLSEKP